MMKGREMSLSPKSKPSGRMSNSLKNVSAPTRVWLVGDGLPFNFEYYARPTGVTEVIVEHEGMF